MHGILYLQRVSGVTEEYPNSQWKDRDFGFLQFTTTISKLPFFKYNLVFVLLTAIIS